MGKISSNEVKDLVVNKVVDLLVTAQANNVAVAWNSNGNDGVPIKWDGSQYRGINILMLWIAQAVNGYSSNRFMTFNQAKKLGGCVRKGETSNLSVYADTYLCKDKDANNVVKLNPDGSERVYKQWYWKVNNVFNVDQIDGLPERFYSKAETVPMTDRLAHAEEYIKNTKADIRYGGNRACYVPSQDFIRLPEKDQFKDMVGLYSVSLHELVHWTMTKDRCNRDFEGSKKFGGKGYATEELVAELGACMGLARLGILAEPRQDHADYIANWLTALKNDKQFIFTASAKAQESIDYLDTLQGEIKEKKVA